MHAALAVSMLLLAAGSRSGLVQHDPFSRAAEVFRYSFEAGQDRDFDHQPDDWTRRKGPLFPFYVNAEIDPSRGRDGSRSLRFDVNGGRVVFYSPPQRIDSLHAYVFEGYIRTQRLKNDAALISLSFLNHRRERVQRVLSKAVSGTHSGWVRVRIGPVFPRKDVWFVVVGCHLVPGRKMDLTGEVWFDGLWLGRLPQLSLESSYQTHFKDPRTPIALSASVGGLDTGARYRLRMQVFDGSDRVIDETLRNLAPPRRAPDDADAPPRPLNVVWKLPPKTHGFYRVRTALERDGVVIIEKFSAFIVMNPVAAGREGEFGWSIVDVAGTMPLKDLAEIAAQSGINWLKFPLWQTVGYDRPNPASEVLNLFDVLTHRRITPVGVLNNPPPEVRRKYPKDWAGISEIFAMPPRFWRTATEPVLARYSSNVRYWQLGSETDRSFIGLKSLGTSLRDVKTEFDKIARDVRIGVPWDDKTPLPVRNQLPRSFVTVVDARPFASKSAPAFLKKTRGLGRPRWVVLRPLPRSEHSSEQRGADLVKRMVTAKANAADAIFAYDVFHPEYGLLDPDGAPSLLFLPWRTTALSLQGATNLGSLRLPQQSENHVFIREGEGTLVLWNEKPAKEELSLNEGAFVTDIWGRRLKLARDPATKRAVIDVGPSPVFLRRLSDPVLRWKLSTKFEVAKFESRRGGQSQAILAENTFSQGISGKITLNVPRGWSVQPRTWQVRAGEGEKLRFPMRITVPANASQGEVPVTIDFEITAEKAYSFRVHRSFEIGMGDVGMQIFDRKLKDGRLEVLQIITNNIDPPQTLDFRCSLFSPGQRRQKRLVTKLRKGKDRKLYYLPSAEAMRGRTLWIRAEQVGGNRVLNFRWKALGPETHYEEETKKKVPPVANGPAEQPRAGHRSSGNG